MSKNFKGIIFDNLLERELKTKKCISEIEAKQEVSKSIKRLCKKFKVGINSNRFYLKCVEIA